MKKRWGAKRGRKPRVGVPRYPSGEIKREYRQKTEDPQAVALEARARLYGSRISAHRRETRQKLETRDPRFGYELGRLQLFGRITQAQHDAGLRWAAIVTRYAMLKGYPAPTPAALDLTAVRGLGAEPDDGDVLKAERRYRDAYTAITSAVDADGRPLLRAIHACKEVCILDTPTDNWPEHMMQALRGGLNSLAAYFLLGGP